MTRIRVTPTPLPFCLQCGGRGCACDTDRMIRADASRMLQTDPHHAVWLICLGVAMVIHALMVAL